MAKKTFDLASLMAQQRQEIVSDSDTIRYLPVDELLDNSGNFYAVDDVRELCDSIAVSGVLQPILVRPAPEGGYLIIAGHRRTKAVRILREEWTGKGENPWASIPAVIRPVPKDRAEELLEELALVTTNSAVRKLTDQELSRQAEKLTEILYGLKSEGYSFPGRMRKLVADAVGVSETKLARIKKIREKLSPGWLARWNAGKVPEYTAEALAGIAPEIQEALLYKKSLDPSTVRALAEYWKRCFAPHACRVSKNRMCDRQEQHWAVGSRKDSPYLRCPNGVYSSGGICCDDCSRVLKCGQACERAKSRAEKRDAAARAAKEKEDRLREKKAAEAERSAEVLWRRFRELREAAGMSVKDAVHLVDGIAYVTENGIVGYEERKELDTWTKGKTPEYYIGFKGCYALAKRFGVPAEALTDAAWQPEAAVPAAAETSAAKPIPVQTPAPRDWWRPFPGIKPPEGERAFVLQRSLTTSLITEARLACWEGGIWHWASTDKSVAEIEVERVEYWFPEPEFRQSPEEED